LKNAAEAVNRFPLDSSLSSVSPQFRRHRYLFSTPHQWFACARFPEPHPPNTFDYNLYFATGGSDSCVFVWQNKSYTGFAAFQKGSGQDAHSVFDSPDLVNDSSNPPNLHLTAGSPTINAGDPAFTPAVGELDYDGNARVIGGRNDCGAYEYNGGGTATLMMAIFPVAGGTTNPASGAHTVPTGVAQSITATAASGYNFVNWTATANAIIADASNSSTTATLTGDATVIAHFSAQTGGVKLTVGSVYQIEAADLDLTDFEWKPRVVGVKSDNRYKANVLTKISKDDHPTFINAGWTKKLCIYDKNVYNKKVVLSTLLSSNPISDLQFDRMIVEYDGVEHDLDATYYLANPNIGTVTGNYSEPDDAFVVAGNYFGSNLPSLYVEYLKNGDENSPGYKKCMLDKSASLKYQNASRNAGKSCMLVYADDPAAGGQSVGHSEIIAIYPSLKATDVPTGYIILDNGVGLDAYYLQGHAGL